jgi:hypothetical protein
MEQFNTCGKASMSSELSTTAKHHGAGFLLGGKGALIILK